MRKKIARWWARKSSARQRIKEQKNEIMEKRRGRRSPWRRKAQE